MDQAQACTRSCPALTLPTGSAWPGTPWPAPSPSPSHVSEPSPLAACHGAGAKEVLFEVSFSEMGFAVSCWWGQWEEG